MRDVVATRHLKLDLYCYGALAMLLIACSRTPTETPRTDHLSVQPEEGSWIMIYKNGILFEITLYPIEGDPNFETIPGATKKGIVLARIRGAHGEFIGGSRDESLAERSKMAPRHLRRVRAMLKLAPEDRCSICIYPIEVRDRPEPVDLDARLIQTSSIERIEILDRSSTEETL